MTGPDPARTVAIVGAGFSGTAVALHLLRAAATPRVLLLDRRGDFGRGLAYGTSAEEHVLNVPASRMSAFPDAPADLLGWVEEQGRRPDPDAFLARRDYARYLGQRLDEAEAGARGRCVLERLPEAALDVGVRGSRLELTLARGAPWPVDEVVLALGNLPPADPLEGRGAERLDPSRYARDPWSPGALDGIDPDAGVLLLGTGLTAVDVLLSLKRRRHRGPVTLLSRRGLLPRPQRAPGGTYGGGYDPAPLLAEAGDLRRLLRTVRAEAARLAAGGRDWRDLVAALRPVTPRLWTSLGRVDRDRFLRHLRPFWDVHRHRMAPAVEDALLGLSAVGAFVARAGRVLEVRPAGPGVAVHWRARGRPDTEVLEVGRVVNATGASPDLRRSHDPFVRGLCDAGWITPDPFGLGLVTEPDGRVVPSDPALPRRLHALGPLRMGGLWESTAVPEIRVQAQDLARRLAGPVTDGGAPGGRGDAPGRPRSPRG